MTLEHYRIACPNGHRLEAEVEVDDEAGADNLGVMDVDPPAACPVCRAAIHMAVDSRSDMQTFHLRPLP